MKTRISSLILALVLLFNLLPFSLIEAFATEKDSTASDDATVTTENEDYITGMVTLTCDGKSDIVLPKGEKLYAFATPDESLGNTLMYSWELMSASGKWASVSGYVSYYAIISEALLLNATTSDGSARMRCIVTSGDKKYVSDVLTILPSSTTETLSSSAPSYLSRPLYNEENTLPVEDEETTEGEDITENGGEGGDTTEGEDTTENGGEGNNSIDKAFNIRIDYTYRHATAAPSLNSKDGTVKFDGSTAHNTFTVTLPPNSYYTGTIATPPEIGYLPYVKVDQKKYITGYVEGMTLPVTTYDGEQYVLAHSIQFTNQSTDIDIHVYFIPQEVTYRVKIYEQNLHDDEYTLAQTLTKIGIANAAVGEGHDTARTGFQPLYYDPKLPISEDGSYVLDIYYDRNYYLVEFDLQSEDAFGAKNHYVRYKTTVMLPTPTRPAHSFINWVLLAVTVKKSETVTETVTEHSYPQTATGGFLISSVEHNMVYQASWRVEKTSYTIIYWLENADNDGFTLDSFEVVSGVKPGDTVSASNTLKNSDASCFTFNAALSDKNVTVKADGTTAINTYYLRNYYTLTFKGNAKCVTPEHTHNAECSQYGHCDLEPHTHTETCGTTGVPICGKVEHEHKNESCKFEEHTHTSECCSVPYHVHSSGAISDCTKTEHPVHHDTCYTPNTIKIADNMTESELVTAYNTLKSKVTGPINGYVYRVRVARGNNTTVYNFFYVHNTWFYLGTGSTYEGISVTNIGTPSKEAGSTKSAAATLKCGLEVHTHGDGTCTCTITEHDHTSGCICKDNLPSHTHGTGDCIYECDTEAHKHNFLCYAQLCGKTAHTHTANCVRECQQVVHTHTTGNTGCQTQKSQNFLTFKYKYNADISRVWQKVWELFPNGERWDANTYFSQVLVYLPFMPPANITFSSDVGSANKIYNISYYLESLDSTGTQYNDRYFTLNNTVNAKYNYLTRAEDFFDIPGFTQFASNPGFSSDQISTNSGGAVSLYYSRNEYDLEFVSLGTTLSNYTRKLKYQQPIVESMELKEANIPYPSNKESGAIRFVGWYTTPNCATGTEFTFDGTTTMPIGGLVLYAKWEACSYHYEIYSDVTKETLLKEETVLFDSLVVEPHHGGTANKPDHDYNPDTPTTNPEDQYKEQLIFAGWYYVEDGVEKRFDFNTMTIKGDMVIYAKWTSRIPVRYTIRYVVHAKDEAGNLLYTTAANGEQLPVYTDIAEATTGASLAGQTKTFLAKVETDLEPLYRQNYFPDVRSHSMTMDSTEAKNVYLFVYSSPEEITYTVTHRFTDSEFEKLFGTGNNSFTLDLHYTLGGEQVDNLAAAIRVSFREGLTEKNLVNAVKEQYPSVNMNATNTEGKTYTKILLDIITGLSPSAYINKLTLTTNQQNISTFEWTKLGDVVMYQIIYYEESLDGNEYIIRKSETHTAEVGTTITLTKDSLAGQIDYFTLDEGMSKMSGVVIKPTFNVSTGTLSQGLVLSLYYKRNTYKYTVSYYKHGTTVEIGEKVVGFARYEQIITVSDVAKQINGYTLVNGYDQIEIAANDSQTINCYYQGLEVYYQYLVVGMGATLNNPTNIVAVGDKPPSKTLTLWSDGYFVKSWTYSVNNENKGAVPASWLSTDNSTGDTIISPSAPTAEWAGKTVYIYAEILPTIRRFRVEGYHSMENDPQAFVFHLEGYNDPATAGINLTFYIFDSGYIDIAQLPYGTYKLSTLHWAWRSGHPSFVTFNEDTQEMKHEVGYVIIDLQTTGDVIIRYSGNLNDDWLSDDASGIFPVGPKPAETPENQTPESGDTTENQTPESETTS